MQLFYTLSGIIALLLFSTGFALMIFRHRQRKAAMDREIDDLLRSQEITATYARLERQDEERRRIAQDLHGGLGSMLSTAKLYFSAIDAKIDLMRLENREQYGKANQLLDEACEEIRRVAYDMQAGARKKFGLKAQLEDLAETISNSKQIKVELVTHRLSSRLDTQLEVNIYRIIRELAGNALKHAKASKLTIQLNRFDDIIHILVEDNGVGFKESAAMEKGGLGLSGILDRVDALNGKINIDSVIGRGTSVSIDLPCQLTEALIRNN
ncbi:MAG: sensor histidine kinase [Phaeodactylibacter sp.]|nr:sensor histidine kinase [Phaeodactylibacter sp.]